MEWRENNFERVRYLGFCKQQEFDMPKAILTRTTLRTSRTLDLASEKELVAQTGHRRDAEVHALEECFEKWRRRCEGH